MTTYNHTAIATGESNAPSTINTRLATLDAAIGNRTSIGGTSLASYVASLVLANGAIVGTLASNTSTTTVTVGTGEADAFVVGARVAYLVSGTIEYNTVSSASGTTIALGTAPSGQIDAGTLIAQVGESEYQQATAINYGNSYTPTAIDVARYAGKQYFWPQAYGAIGNGSADDTAALQAAIDAASTANGGIVPIVGTFLVSSQIDLKEKVQLSGARAGSYSGTFGSVIKPDAGFTDTAVISADPASYGSGTFIQDIGISDLMIDMDNVQDDGIIAIELLSVANPGTFQNIKIINQNTGQYLYIGRTGNAGALASDGITFLDFYTRSADADPANTDPGVIIEGANEIVFAGGATKIQRASSGSFASGSIGVLIRTSAAGSRCNAITFDASSIAGYETCIKVIGSSSAGPRHVRVINCTFETYRYGVWMEGISAAPAQYGFTAGNRFLSAYGADPRDVVLAAYASNNTIILDELAPAGTSGTAKLVEMQANSSGNTIWAQPSQVSNAGTNNLVYGRIDTFFQVGTGAETSTGVVINAASGTSYPQVSFQRAGSEVANIQYNTSYDGLAISVAGKIFRLDKDGELYVGTGTESAPKLIVDAASGTSYPQLSFRRAGTEIGNLKYNNVLTGMVLEHNTNTSVFRNDGVVALPKLGIANSAAATTPGSVTAKIEVFNASGTSLGFIAVYDAIT